MKKDGVEKEDQFASATENGRQNGSEQAEKAAFVAHGRVRGFVESRRAGSLVELTLCPSQASFVYNLPNSCRVVTTVWR